MIQDRVVIVGGGVAGLCAAVELVDLGIDVTILEAADRCGGKLSAWRDQDGDPVEHGVHGWWPNYVNWMDVMRRVGIPAGALQVPAGTVAIRGDGSAVELKPLPVRLPSPLFLAAYFLKSPIKGLVDLVSVVRAGLHILSFQAPRDFGELDRFTFRSWLWRMGVSERMYEFFFEPYVLSFAFDSASRISAAATLSSYQLYLVRHQEDLLARWLTGDPDSLVIEPIVNYIRQHGGRVVTGVSVNGLQVDAHGYVSGVVTSKPVDEGGRWEPQGSAALTRVDLQAIPAQGSVAVATEHGDIRLERHNGRVLASALEGPEALGVNLTGGAAVVTSASTTDGTEIARVPLASLPAQGLVAVQGSRPLLVGRTDGNTYIALSAVCTHAGCTVEWQTATAVIKCPCHGGRYGSDGRVLSPPPVNPLPVYATKVDGADLVVLAGGSGGGPILEAEHIILAVDVEACKRIVNDRLRELDTFRRIDALTTTPVLVVRLWFSGERLLGDYTSGVFISYPLLDNFFVLSNLQASFRAGPDTVVEVQAYRVKDAIHLADEPLMTMVLGDLRRAFPKLDMPPRKFHVLRHPAVFSHCEAGSDANRPDTHTPVPNLYLAADWVQRAPETWNMERAAVTGRRAAQAVIEKLGGVGPSVLAAPMGGPLLKRVIAIVRSLGAMGAALGRFVRGDLPAAPPRPPASLRWTSRVFFGVTKFKGQPNEQLVNGSFREVSCDLHLRRVGASYVGTGIFKVDLDSLDTGIQLRDYNVRSALLRTAIQRYAEFRLLETEAIAADSAVKALAGIGLVARCKGEVSLNGVTRPVSFGVRVRLGGDGLLTASASEDILLRASEFNLDLTALTARCGARVDDQIRIGFRAALAPVFEPGLRVTSRT